MKKFSTVSAALLLALAGRAHAQVQHGGIDVVELNNGNTPASISMSRVGGAGPWTVVSDAGDQSSRGDYVVDFATGADQTLGVMMVGVSQISRIEPSVFLPEYFANAMYDRASAGFGRYYVSINACPSGAEVNYNCTLAYFPIADGWLTGAVYNSVNNGPITSYVGTPGIALRTEADATYTGVEIIDTTTDAGRYTLHADGIDFSRDGLLLACGAKNEDNRAQVAYLLNGDAVIHCIDNGSESGGENDPAAFVFIPEGTAGVTMGSITGSGHALFHQGDFSVELVGQPTLNGTYRLTIPGESPATGTLILGNATDFTGTNIDNSVFMQPDGDGWLLTTRDTEPNPSEGGTGMTLQDLGSNDIAFVFAFFKNDVAILPGTPSHAHLQRRSESGSARFHVTEYSAGNGIGEMLTQRVAGSDLLDVCGDNRGDVGISYLGARFSSWLDNSLDAREGVVMGSSSELIRDNSATGGAGGWSTVSFDNGEVHTQNASLAGPEINSDVALAFFPASLGLIQDAEINAENGAAVVAVPGNAATDGVLMAMNWDNSNRIVTATPNGSQYDIAVYEGAGGAQAVVAPQFGYVYLPYTLQGLVAGQIGVKGDVLSGTPGFSVALSTDPVFGFDTFSITIDGVDARTDGVLLVTATTGPQAVSWQPGPSGEFVVAALDLTVEFPGRAPFAFAYIPYTGVTVPPVDTCTADFNNDDAVSSQDFFDFITAFFSSDVYADVNPDRFLSSQDFFDFITAFFSCDVSADVNHDGFISSQDFFDFITAFFTGC